MKPLLYLEYRVIVNSIRNIVRSPKRLIPALIIGAWFMSSIFYGVILQSQGISAARSVKFVKQMPIEVVQAVLFLLLAFGSVAIIYSAFTSGLLVFQISHVDFMFPTPVSRRAALAFNLAKDYMKYALWLMFMFIVLTSNFFARMGGTMFPYSFASIAALVGFLITAVNISHIINISFTFGYERFRQAGLVFKILFAAVGAGAVAYIATKTGSGASVPASLDALMNSPLANTVFLPAKWTARLCLAPVIGIDSAGYMHIMILWVAAVASAAALLAHPENIYEPSLASSYKANRRLQAMRAGNIAAARIDEMRDKGAKTAKGVSVPAFGRGAVAILWKSLLIRYRVSQSQSAFAVIIGLIALFAMSRTLDDVQIIEKIPLVLIYVAYILAITQQGVMRGELKVANVIKPMPIPAWKVMLAEIMSAVVYISFGCLAFIFAFWAFFPAARTEYLWGTAVQIPFLTFAIIPCAVIGGIMYPQARDFTQNYIGGLVTFLILSLAMLPSVIIAVVLLVVVKVPILYTTGIVAFTNLLVGVVGVSVAGALYSAFDPTGE